MNINKKQNIMIAAAVVIGGLAIFATINALPVQSAVAQLATSHRHSPPEPFAITVNGHKEPTVVATIKRGQTAQLDVFISPKIDGITGDVSVQSVRPECGTAVSKIGCTPAGITATLSENTVSAAKHLVLTINVSDSMPAGTYSYEVTSMAQSVNAGDIDSFAITVT
ncbi:MAG: hypothetical protein ACREBJ_12275 [Nitrosotalea sp.]